MTASVPLYEYQCARCGRFEIIRKFSDSPLLTCPTCGGEVQKLFSAPAIQFKGTGWYITDYARKSTGKETGKGGEGKTGEGKTGEGPSTSSDAKDGASSKDTSKSESGAKAASGGDSGSKGSPGGSTT